MQKTNVLPNWAQREHQLLVLSVLQNSFNYSVLSAHNSMTDIGLREVDWSHLRRNCLLQRVIEGKIQGG
jgi:hypothetical protein